MISKKMEKALNEQINAEMYSAYLYLAMAAYFEAENLGGLANWMKIQVQEETAHAMKFFSFVNERRGRVVLKALDEPTKEWKSPLAAFEASFKHEQIITGRINDLVNLAVQEKDHATNAFLQWFVTEQVEEETSVDTVIQMLKMADKAPGALLMIDRELGRRQFNPPK